MMCISRKSQCVPVRISSIERSIGNLTWHVSTCTLFTLRCLVFSKISTCYPSSCVKWEGSEFYFKSRTLYHIYKKQMTVLCIKRFRRDWELISPTWMQLFGARPIVTDLLKQNLSKINQGSCGFSYINFGFSQQMLCDVPNSLESFNHASLIHIFCQYC